MENNIPVTIFLSLLGGGSFLTFIQFFINRFDKKKEGKSLIFSEVKKNSQRLTELQNNIDIGFDRLNKKIDANDAIQKRVRILRFFDEVQNHNYKHSTEAWNQTIDDIFEYEKYCEENDDFLNSKAKDAIKNLKLIHDDLLKKQRNGENIYI